jgi:tetratricopeptide (TPR) repeat protein
MFPDRSLLMDIERFEAEYAERPDGLVFARLADAYRKTGDPERALSILEDGLSRHPNYFSALIVQGRAFRDLNRAADAERAFRRVLDLDAENLVALQALAELAREQGDLEEAAAWYERLTQVDPLNEGAARAFEELAARDMRQATEVIARELATAEPGHPRPPPGPEGDTVVHDSDLLTQTMAELYASQGLFEEAEAVYLELLKFRPGDPVLLERLEATRARIPRDTGHPLGRRLRHDPASSGGAKLDPGAQDPPEAT